MNEFEESRSLIEAVKREIAKEIIGQEEIIDQLLMVLLSGGNVLMEGMPGLGKTRLVHTISHVFDLSFKRIQFTPDLMPQDITGTSILMRTENGSEFTFRKGPVFANVVLADEINRATPKTQSALLEAMQEGTVTEGGQTHVLPQPFFVLATQNPIETEGTYPLPEAQLDRFSCKLNLDFPKGEQLKRIVLLTECDEDVQQAGVADNMVMQGAAGASDAQKTAQKICDRDTLVKIQSQIRQIRVADPVMDHLVEIIEATHEKSRFIKEGSSPRGAQAMLRMARARAFLQGRYNVSFEDVRFAAYPVLRHRIIPSFDAISEGVSPDRIIDGILQNHPVKNV